MHFTFHLILHLIIIKLTNNNVAVDLLVVHDLVSIDRTIRLRLDIEVLVFFSTMSVVFNEGNPRDVFDLTDCIGSGFVPFIHSDFFTITHYFSPLRFENLPCFSAHTAPYIAQKRKLLGKFGPLKNFSLMMHQKLKKLRKKSSSSNSVIIMQLLDIVEAGENLRHVFGFDLSYFRSILLFFLRFFQDCNGNV